MTVRLDIGLQRYINTSIFYRRGGLAHWAIHSSWLRTAEVCKSLSQVWNRHKILILGKFQFPQTGIKIETPVNGSLAFTNYFLISKTTQKEVKHLRPSHSFTCQRWRRPGGDQYWLPTIKINSPTSAPNTQGRLFYDSWAWDFKKEHKFSTITYQPIN